MKVGKSSIQFDNVYLKDSSIVVGPKEKNGPLGQYFDFSFDDLYCYEKSFEKAEIRMYNTAFDINLNKAKVLDKEIDLVISGDLNNQIVISSYSMRNYDTPYLGIFSACATSVEGLILGSIFINYLNYNYIVVNASSHNAVCEKQFRFPNEYGGQKPQYITSTVTAATSILLCNEENITEDIKIKFKKATIGKVIDYTISDPQDLGRSMAPACFHTLKEHLNDFKIDVNYYDLILSGDLSKFGKELFVNICDANNIDIKNIYNDCGLMIYDLDKQDVHSGGSGSGCLPAVCFSYIINEMKNGKIKRVLLLATGALHNPSILNQKESIPGICHAISIERE